VELGALPSALATQPGQPWYRSASPNAAGRPNLVVSRLPAEQAFEFEYADGTRFLIDGAGSRIWCDRPSAVSAEEVALYIRGPILGMVLRLRGIVCLHASSVAIGHSAIAVVGSAGAGKSTTAAGFVRLGRRLLADDVSALRLDGDGLSVLPGPPRVSLWPDAGEAIFGNPSLPRVTPPDGISAWWDKRYVDVHGTASFQDTPLPLSAVYILWSRDAGISTTRIEPVGPKDAFLALTDGTYVNYAIDEPMRAREFEVLGRLVRSLPIRRVDRPDDASRVLEVCRAILDDAASIEPPCTPSTTTAT
jgi:hypothetical protein